MFMCTVQRRHINYYVYINKEIDIEHYFLVGGILGIFFFKFVFYHVGRGWVMVFMFCYTLILEDIRHCYMLFKLLLHLCRYIYTN